MHVEVTGKSQCVLPEFNVLVDLDDFCQDLCKHIFLVIFHVCWRFLGHLEESYLLRLWCNLGCIFFCKWPERYPFWIIERTAWFPIVDIFNDLCLSHNLEWWLLLLSRHWTPWSSFPPHWRSPNLWVCSVGFETDAFVDDKYVRFGSAFKLASLLDWWLVHGFIVGRKTILLKQRRNINNPFLLFDSRASNAVERLDSSGFDSRCLESVVHSWIIQHFPHLCSRSMIADHWPSSLRRVSVQFRFYWAKRYWVVDGFVLDAFEEIKLGVTSYSSLEVIESNHSITIMVKLSKNVC